MKTWVAILVALGLAPPVALKFFQPNLPKTAAAVTPAGITISRTSGLSTSEDGGSDTFTIVLDTQPSANVTIALSSSNTDEAYVWPAQVVFTSANWSTPQTVTTYGQRYTVNTALRSDELDNGAVWVPGNGGGPAAITVTANAGVAPDGTTTAERLQIPAATALTQYTRIYQGVAANFSRLGLWARSYPGAGNQTFFFMDDDAAGANVITCNTTENAWTYCSGLSGDGDFSIGQNTYMTALQSPPYAAADVLVWGASSDYGAGRCPTAGASDTCGDNTQDGDQSFTIVTAAASSSDTNYNGIDPSDVTGTNHDDMTPILRFAMTDGGSMGTACACASIGGLWSDGLPAPLTTTRASSATCLPANQFTGISNGDLDTCTSNQTRVTTYGGSSLGVLSEAAATNTALYSEQLDNGAWAEVHVGAAAVIVTANYGVAPDGTTTADRLQADAVSAGQYSLLSQSGACASGVQVNASVFLKGTSGSGEVCLVVNGTVGTVCPYNSTTWTRCVNGGTTVGAAAMYVGTDIVDCPTAQTSAQDVLVWGAQCETGTVTSYVATTSASATRAVETHKFQHLPNTMNSGCAAVSYIPQPYATYSGNWGPAVVHGAAAAFHYGEGNNVKMYDGVTALARAVTQDGGQKRFRSWWNASDGGMQLCNDTDSQCTAVTAYDKSMPLGGAAILDFCSAVQIGTFGGKAACSNLVVGFEPEGCQ